MSVSPLHLISNFSSYISGEVTLDPNVAIAPGVILQAELNSRIIIAAGVCIGMGVILYARDGILEIETGVILGAGVLIIGKGKIGANACIGSATTILNCSIEPGRVVAPSSLLGDTSRQVALSTTVSQITTVESTVVSETPQSEETKDNQSSLAPTNSAGAQVVYGKASLTRLVATLFPYSQSLKQPLQGDSSPSE